MATLPNINQALQKLTESIKPVITPQEGTPLVTTQPTATATTPQTAQPAPK